MLDNIMIAIILAGGRGTRMGALTNDCPKPMLKVHGKTLIEWKLEALPKEIAKVIIIVGYLKEKIVDYFGNSWKGIAIEYIEQKELDGTGGAVMLCKESVKDKALILMGDDIYNREDLNDLVNYDFAMLVDDQGDEALTKKGQVVEKDGLLFGLNENSMQTGIISTLINTGACSITKDFFSYPLIKNTETEYGLPHTLVSQAKHIPIHIIKARKWIQITSPECLTRAEKIIDDL